eukprot:6207703-Pleurochrysis_carterae.AAC.2
MEGVGPPRPVSAGKITSASKLAIPAIVQTHREQIDSFAAQPHDDLRHKGHVSRDSGSSYGQTTDKLIELVEQVKHPYRHYEAIVCSQDGMRDFDRNCIHPINLDCELETTLADIFIFFAKSSGM